MSLWNTWNNNSRAEAELLTLIRGQPVQRLSSDGEYNWSCSWNSAEVQFHEAVAGDVTVNINVELHRIEEHFNSSDPRRMWQGIRTIPDHKPSSTAPHTNGASLSDELSHFYARFDRGNKVVFSKMDLPPGEQPLTLSTTDVCHTLRRVSARKAAGPDEVPGRVLKACAEQLAGVDCVPVYGSNSIIKFADDTTVIGLIRGDDETAYRDEVQHLAAWCDVNNLVLNSQKTKEVIVDFKEPGTHSNPHQRR
ncbi:hypothetical protein NFI96_027906 [Prochilodus magdalenae]|nr:hypothetical protein NFI96_027906 [Prochilodus magdalenae]